MLIMEITIAPSACWSRAAVARLSSLQAASSGGGAADTGGTVRHHQGQRVHKVTQPGQQRGEANTLPALFFDEHVTFFTLQKNKSLLWQSANVFSKYEDDIYNNARCFSFRGLLDPCKVTKVGTRCIYRISPAGPASGRGLSAASPWGSSCWSPGHTSRARHQLRGSRLLNGNI